MNNLNEKINACKLCGNLPKLTENSLKYGKTRFVIIGESPAKDGWIESKKAFYNTSGKLQATGKVLEKLLNSIGLTIDDIYFTECCTNCTPILIEQLNNIPCDTILTMGLYPTQALLKTKIKTFRDYVGKEFIITLGYKKYKLIPIYHPSPLNPKGFKDNLPIFDRIKKDSI